MRSNQTHTTLNLESGQWSDHRQNYYKQIDDLTIDKSCKLQQPGEWVECTRHGSFFLYTIGEDQLSQTVTFMVRVSSQFISFQLLIYCAMRASVVVNTDDKHDQYTWVWLPEWLSGLSNMSQCTKYSREILVWKAETRNRLQIWQHKLILLMSSYQSGFNYVL